jgi:ABC-type oligopeptide transport system ATPase subunit
LANITTDLALSDFYENTIKADKRVDPIKFTYEKSQRFWDIKPIRRYVDYLEINGWLDGKPNDIKYLARKRDLTKLLYEEIEFSIRKTRAIIGQLLGDPGSGKSTAGKILLTINYLVWKELLEKNINVYVTWNPAETRRAFRKLKHGDAILQDEFNRQSGKGSRTILNNIANLLETTRQAQNSFYTCSPTDREVIKSFVLIPFGIKWDLSTPYVRCYLLDPHYRHLGMVYLPILILEEIEKNYDSSKESYIRFIKSVGGSETAFIDEERARVDIKFLLDILEGHETKELIEAKANNRIHGDYNYLRYVINHTWEKILEQRQKDKIEENKHKKQQLKKIKLQQLALIDQVSNQVLEDLDLNDKSLKNSAIRAYLREKGIIDKFHSEALQKIHLLHYLESKKEKHLEVDSFNFDKNDDWIQTMQKYILKRTDSNRAERIALIYPYYVANSKKSEAYNKIGKAEYGVSLKSCYLDFDYLVDFLSDSKISSEIGAIVFETFFKNQMKNRNFQVLNDSEAGYLPGIDCLLEISSGKKLVISLKCYHRNKNTLQEGSFSSAEADYSIKNNVPLIAILWNPFWNSYLCKYVNPNHKKRITWKKAEIGNKQDKEIKKLLFLDE